jgi:type I restriction enzyme R subunit
MTFLVRRVHLHYRLGEFTVVVVTDRTQLQDQLSETLKLSRSDVVNAETCKQMEGLLRDGGQRVVFATIQRLAAYAASNRGQFLARSRGEQAA